MKIPSNVQFAFVRVNEVPSQTQSNTWYSIEQGKFNQLYLTDNDNVPTFTTGKITKFNKNNIVDTARLDAINNIWSVETIADRNVLIPTLLTDALIYVSQSKLATGASGSSVYFFDFTNQSFIEIQHIEKFDFEVYWENVVDRPRNSVEEIENTILTVVILYNLVMQLQDDITDIQQTPQTYVWSGTSEW